MKRRSLVSLAAATVLAIVAAVAPATPAFAVVPNGTYSPWTWPATSTGYYNFDQRLTVLGHSSGTHYFWAHQMHFVDGDGGYLGLQIGSFPNNTKIALFSLWSANGAQGANCGTFVEGTPGYTCRLDPYPWVIGREYRLRVWSLGVDPQGEWWGAWVQDTVTGVDSFVGQIRVPVAWSGLYPWSVSWTEYFGARPRTCSQLPWARARFAFPTANAGTVQIASHTHTIGSGECPTASRITEVPGADIQEMGRPPH